MSRSPLSNQCQGHPCLTNVKVTPVWPMSRSSLSDQCQGHPCLTNVKVTPVWPMSRSPLSDQCQSHPCLTNVKVTPIWPMSRSSLSDQWQVHPYLTNDKFTPVWPMSRSLPPYPWLSSSCLASLSLHAYSFCSVQVTTVWPMSRSPLSDQCQGHCLLTRDFRPPASPACPSMRTVSAEQPAAGSWTLFCFSCTVPCNHPWICTSYTPTEE